MESLRKHFVDNPDIDLNEVPEKFDILSRKLEVIHSRNAVVRPLNSDTIDYDDLDFLNISRPVDFEQERRNNIVALGKIMAGCYVSNGTGFKDFSEVNDDWFKENIDNIFDIFDYKDFDKEYFEPLFNGNIVYFSDYLNKKRQTARLNGAGKTQGFMKVLKNPNAPGIDTSYEDDNKLDMAARMHTAFNPLLIGLSIAIIAIITIMVILLN